MSLPDHEGMRLVDVGVMVAHDIVEAAVQEVHRMRDWRAHVLCLVSIFAPCLLQFSYLYVPHKLKLLLYCLKLQFTPILTYPKGLNMNAMATRAR